MEAWWDEVRVYLCRRAAQVASGLETADVPNFYRLQGKAELIRELMRLPDILREERELDKQERAIHEATQLRGGVN